MRSPEKNEGGDASKHVLDALVGPFYNASSLTTYLSITPAELAALVESGQVLETKLDNGDGLYPTFQFEGGALLPRLDEVIGALDDPGIDGWSVAIMLNARIPEWGDRSAAELLRTEWAGETLHQIEFDERAPLDKRARFEEHYVIATAIMDELMPRIAGLPVEIDAATLVVGEGDEGFGAGVLVRDTRLERSLALLSFGLAGDPGDIAVGLARQMEQQSTGSPIVGSRSERRSPLQRAPDGTDLEPKLTRH